MSKTTRLSAWKHVDDHSLRFIECEEVDRLDPVAFADVHAGPGFLRIHIGIYNGYVQYKTLEPEVAEYQVNLLSVGEVHSFEARLKACGCADPSALLLHLRESAERAFDKADKQRARDDDLKSLRDEMKNLYKQVLGTSEQVRSIASEFDEFTIALTAIHSRMSRMTCSSDHTEVRRHEERQVVQEDPFKAALLRERYHIASVHHLPNGLIATFDREGKQMPCFQGEAKEILPLLAACGWKGNVQWSELKERTAR